MPCTFPHLPLISNDQTLSISSGRVYLAVYKYFCVLDINGDVKDTVDQAEMEQMVREVNAVAENVQEMNVAVENTVKIYVPLLIILIRCGRIASLPLLLEVVPGS